MKVNYLQGFEVIPNRNYILARLGYIKHKAETTPIDRMQIEQWIDESLQLARPRGAYMKVKMLKKDNDKVIMTWKNEKDNEGDAFQDIVLKSQKLYSFLDAYDELLLMGATIGPKIVKCIKEEFLQNPSKAVVYDAAASQSADACLDVMVTLLTKVYGLKGQTLSPRRYSPGYGDLSLETQKVIANVLELDKIGITVTGSFMLEPEKSVIAIVGLK